MGSPSTVTCFSSRCQPRGRTMRVGSFLSVRSLYSFDPCMKSTWRRTASYRFTWPLTMFSQVGALESVE